jgi:hypothetical protein
VHGILSIHGDGVNVDLPLRAKRANDDSPLRDGTPDKQGFHVSV